MLSQWVERHFSAAHEGDGVMHGHTWVVRAYWPYDGADIRERANALDADVRQLDHSTLPSNLSRAEELAEWFGEGLKAARVEVWREREGYGATWTA